jgi:hypothetical protein
MTWCVCIGPGVCVCIFIFRDRERAARNEVWNKKFLWFGNFGSGEFVLRL